MPLQNLCYRDLYVPRGTRSLNFITTDLKCVNPGTPKLISFNPTQPAAGPTLPASTLSFTSLTTTHTFTPTQITSHPHSGTHLGQTLHIRGSPSDPVWWTPLINLLRYRNYWAWNRHPALKHLFCVILTHNITRISCSHLTPPTPSIPH